MLEDSQAVASVDFSSRCTPILTSASTIEIATSDWDVFAAW
jgi:hypothetical protein